MYRVWKTELVERRLRELIELFENRILDRRTNHLHHFFDEAWNVRSDSYTFGHDIEAAWLLCEAAEVLGDAQVLRRVQALAVKISAAVLQEAVSSDSGLCYEGRGGRLSIRGRSAGRKLRVS